MPSSAKESKVLDIGSRLELFVDRYLLDHLKDAWLELHPPTRREIALQFDAPWEGVASGYPTVIQDGDTYRMYFRGKTGETPDGTPDEVTCYAESPDGVHWTRPKLGLFEVGGTRENNVILGTEFGPVTHNFTPFIDTRPGVPPAERFKGFGRLFRMAGHRSTDGLIGLASADGIHWKKMADKAIIDHSVHPLNTDTAQSCAFWSEMEQRYVCYIRSWYGPGKPQHPGWAGSTRWISRTTSEDFATWSVAQLISFGDAPLEHLYTNQVVPYSRAPHIYIGLPFRFVPERKAVPEHPYPGVSDGVFITSRDGLNWDRTFLEAFIRPGRDRRNWTERSNAAARGIVSTAPDELSIYWTEHKGHPTSRLRRGTLRMDGFASVHAGYAGGEVLTHPLRFAGSGLVLNYATSAVGSVRVEVQDEDGRPIPGYTLAESPEMYGDEIEGVVCWQDGTSVAALAGRPVRLRLVLRDADVYTLRFRP